MSEDLCLGYVNTLSWRGSAAPAEKLRALEDILGWIERSKALPRAAIRAARQRSRGHERRGASLFTEAVALREALFRIFSAVAAGAPIGKKDFAVFGDALARAPARHRLVARPGGFAWDIPQNLVSVPDLLAPVLWSAADLLLNAGHRRVRRCANEDCLWLFIDRSKTGTRRWCDMSACGNRAKSRRHYARIKGGP